MQNKLNSNIYNLFAYKNLNTFNFISQRQNKEIPIRQLYTIQKYKQYEDEIAK